MNPKQKRSNGGYGLRRKIAKKRLDEDFEYYFSKIGTHLEATSKPVKDQKIQTQLVMVAELVSSSDKTNMKINESLEKRPRGRPKKVQSNQSPEADFVKLVDLKEKRVKNLSLEGLETSRTLDDSGAAMKVDEPMECLVKRVKLDSFLSGDGITGLQEEEVTSLPEGEKENLPEDGIHLDVESDPEEGIETQMDVNIHGDVEERAIYEEDENEKGPALARLRRKYKKGRLSQEAIQKLSSLGSDEKIECNECHKLLKPSSFRQHLRTHTGEKPFGCEVCDARFTRKGDVERHVRIVHNKQKPFKCCRCQRAFGDKKNLRWHLMNHDKKLFYVCEVCGFKFGKREYWENHVRFIHPIPGGIGFDDTNIAEEDIGEDRLRTLTKTLLGEDESAVDDPSQDCVAAVKSIENEEEHEQVITQASRSEGLKIINLKSLNLPGLVKIAQAKPAVNFDTYARLVSENQGGGIDAVVIQFEGSDSEGSMLQTVEPIAQQFDSSNLVHVVESNGILELVNAEQSQSQQSIVIETQDLSEGEVPVMDCPPDVIQEQVVEVEDEDEEPSKVISIMLSEDTETVDTSPNSSSVQTLIEALLVAAKGDGQSS